MGGELSDGSEVGGGEAVEEGFQDLGANSEVELSNLQATLAPLRGGQWSPGNNCGERVCCDPESWVPLAVKVVMNVFLNFRQLPGQLCTTILRHLTPNMHRSDHPTLRCAAQFGGIKAHVVRRMFSHCQLHSWRLEQVATKPTEPTSVSAVGMDPSVALRVRVREALHTCYAGMPLGAYVGAIQRMKFAGLSLGNLYDHHSFVEEVEHKGLLAAQSLFAMSIHELVPSLGIPSDIMLTWDGVSIGRSMFSRHETLALIGIGYSSVQAGCRIRQRLCAALSEALRKRGPLQTSLVLNALCSHPAHLSREKLRKRLALISGDGALTSGGPQSVHPSSRALELLWAEVRPDVPDRPLVDWDLFHRLCTAVGHAIAHTPATAEIFDVGRALGQLFGTGDGRALYRSAMASLGNASTFRVGLPDQGGSRKVVQLVRTIQYIMAHMRDLHASLHARIGLTEAGLTSQTKDKLVDVCRRVSEVSFVVYSLAVMDTMQRLIVPLALVAQEDEIRAFAIWRHQVQVRDEILALPRKIDLLWTWLFVSSLVGQYTARPDMARLWMCLLISPLGRNFPHLVGALDRLLWSREYNSCTLHVDWHLAEETNNVHAHAIAPRCQCGTMRSRRRCECHSVDVGKSCQCTVVRLPRRATVAFEFAHRARSERRLHAMRVRVPEWVAHSLHDPRDFVNDVKSGLGPHDVMPRFLIKQKESHTPAFLQGESRFKQPPSPCRCIAPLPIGIRQVRADVARPTGVVPWLSWRPRPQGGNHVRRRSVF